MSEPRRSSWACRRAGVGRPAQEARVARDRSAGPSLAARRLGRSAVPQGVGVRSSPSAATVAETNSSNPVGSPSASWSWTLQSGFSSNLCVQAASAIPWCVARYRPIMAGARVATKQNDLPFQRDSAADQLDVGGSFRGRRSPQGDGLSDLAGNDQSGLFTGQPWHAEQLIVIGQSMSNVVGGDHADGMSKGQGRIPTPLAYALNVALDGFGRTAGMAPGEVLSHLRFGKGVTLPFSVPDHPHHHHGQVPDGA